MGFFPSCVDDVINSNESIDKGDSIKLTMSLSLPQMQSMQTRGVLDKGVLDKEDLNPLNPSVDYLQSLKLYMFIFENTGSPESNYLLTLVHGDNINVTATEKEDENSQHPGQILQTYTANVEGTSENAIIHLVATSDIDFEEQLQNATDRTELGLFYGSNGLYTSGEYPAFWKRIDLNMPITKENKSDIEALLSHVQMIRNFCRITVKMDEKYNNPYGFVIDGYTLVNQVDAAYVAAYSDNDPRGFVEFEESGDSGNLTGKMKSYSDILITDKYIPARHPSSVRQHKEEDHSWLHPEGGEDNVFTNSPKYMFERPYQEQHRTFVIIKGHFRNSTDYRYIKLDIGDIPEWLMDSEKGFYLSSAFEYRHLYRNFSYDIVINTIASTNVGSATAAGAVSGPAVNNVGATVETQSITDISDGIDRMFVNETKFVIVDDNNGNPYPAYYDLMWRYVSDWQGKNINDTQYIKYDYPGKELVANDDSGIFGTLTPIANGTKWPNGWENDNFGEWSGMTIYFKKPDETVRQKTVRLYYSDPSTDKPNVRLSRDITFVMRKRWEFVTDNLYPSNVEVYPGAYSYENGTMPYNSLKDMRKNITPGYVGSQRGAQLTVMFELPDDLPESLFPLEFKIGFDRQNVENAYVGNAFVTTGPSMFEDDPGGVGVMRMQFIKTVTWDYYNGSGDYGDNGHKIVTARFVTTNDVLDESGFTGDTSKTRVRISNPYFTLGQDVFERAAHDDVIDPTRTYWYWNFSYPEWATYFTTYYGQSNDPFNLNNLSFDLHNGYEREGSYMDIGQAYGSDEDDSSAERPDLYFPVDFSIDDYNGTLIVYASVARGRDNKVDRGVIHSGYPNRYDFDLYDRDLHAAVLLDDNNIKELNCTSNNFRLTQTSSGSNNGNPRDPVYVNFSLNNIPEKTRIKEIRVWGVRTSEYSTANYNYHLKAGKTRYFSIEFTLTPK